MRLVTLRAVPVALGLVACFGPVWADEPAHDHGGEHCLNLQLIASSEALEALEAGAKKEWYQTLLRYALH